MLVTILVQLVSNVKNQKELDEYLYRNDGPGCYIRDVIAADGKETQNTRKKNSDDVCDKRNLNEFNVMSTEWGICLSPTRIDEKSNEIPEMQDVMGKPDCRGCVVTADAMNTQKETARAIVKEAGGDYCPALKEKQKNAYHEVKDYFADEGLLKEIMASDGRYLKEIEKISCGIVTREYFITDNINWFADRKDWEKLSTIGYERKTTVKKGTDEIIIEERYFLCSIKPIAELFAIVVRRHWHIENSLHWALDIVFKEDKLRSKEKTGYIILV